MVYQAVFGFSCNFTKPLRMFRELNHYGGFAGSTIRKVRAKPCGWLQTSAMVEKQKKRHPK